MVFSKVNGWLIIDKNYGISSAKVVHIVKKSLKLKKVGHIGTLDPLATGVLPLALGEATKTIPYICNLLKIYKFTIKWGEETSTGDTEGDVTKTSSCRPVVADIKRVIKDFIGFIDQEPHKYSAIKVNGKRAYDLSRQGIDFSLKKRKIEIKAIHVTSINSKNHANFEVTCGSGTYVRSLARDIAISLGTYGHVVSLRRLKVGLFSEESALSIKNDINKEDCVLMNNSILPINRVLNEIPVIVVKKNDMEKLKRGEAVVNKILDENKYKIAQVKYNNNLVSIANIREGHIYPRRNFNF